MKKDEFASINTTKKHGKAIIVVIAVAALCLAGFLYAWKLQKESSSVFLETGSVELAGEEENNG